MQSDSLERFNKQGLRDVYNVLKHIESKKGGKEMVDPKKPIHPKDDEPLDDEDLEIEEEEDEETDDDDDQEDEEEPLDEQPE